MKIVGYYCKYRRQYGKIHCVAIGGAIGALCRMALGEWVMTKVSLLSIWNGCSKPSLVASLLALVLGPIYAKARFIAVGEVLPSWLVDLGAFTTFSTFAFEMLQLMMAESYVEALILWLCTSCRELNLCWIVYCFARILVQSDLTE